MQALAGMRIIDVTRVVAGPYCTFQLALHGADCIKIEEPGRGDPVRWSGAGSTTEFRKRGMATNFLPQNANKRSITLDLRKPEGKAVFLDLVRGADVVVENFRAGVMDGLGLGYADLKKINPKLVFCSMTGYGQLPPKRHHTAYDGSIQAAGGMMSVTGTKETGPLKVGPVIIDYATGMAAAFAIGMALLQRERSGDGQYIDVSMLDTSLTMMSANVVDYLCTGNVPAAHGNAPASRSPSSGIYDTLEGRLSINATEDHQARRLCRALGLGHLLEDPRFAELEERRKHGPELAAEFARVLMTRTAVDWEQRLNDAGVPVGCIRNIAEVMAHPQVTGRGLVHRFKDVEAAGGDVPILMAPFRFEHDGPKAVMPPPTVGQHTEDILKGLGYDDAKIGGLRKAGAI